MTAGDERLTAGDERVTAGDELVDGIDELVSAGEEPVAGTGAYVISGAGPVDRLVAIVEIRDGRVLRAVAGASHVQGITGNGRAVLDRGCAGPLDHGACAPAGRGYPLVILARVRSNRGDGSRAPAISGTVGRERDA